MVGTSMIEVILYFSIAASTFPGSNPGSTTIEPPCSSAGTKNAAPAWESGVQMRWRTSSGHCHSAIWIWVIARPAAVGAHHALGLAGRAAGVGEPGDVVRGSTAGPRACPP